MDYNAKNRSAFLAASIGSCGLATAMGIGRFAFTPMLPLMQAAGTVTLQEGSLLATANYAGYLLGAVLCLAFNPPPVVSARLGLFGVTGATLVMAAQVEFPGWLGARFLAGVASAFVLIGVSSWSLAILDARGRSGLSGWVFGGVGLGIVMAGSIALVVSAIDLPASAGWLCLGVLACATMLLPFATWGHTRAETSPDKVTASARPRSSWILAVSYGVAGFGYIIPATYLPAAARSLVNDPAVYGWTWPLFGFAAAISTIVGALVLRDVSPRRSWAAAHIVMAVGVALPAFDRTLLSLCVSALCVGGTFLLITMNGMQEARRIAGRAAPRLMAVMTIAFALGQLLGPYLVSGNGSAADAIRVPSFAAAALLLVTAFLLLITDGRTANGLGAPSMSPYHPNGSNPSEERLASRNSERRHS